MSPLERPREFTRTEVADQLGALGLKRGGVLLVHTSFRAIRPVEGGPVGLVAALLESLGPQGTLVMPSWTGDDATPFDPASTPASPDLGVVADTFWRMGGVVRSNHPFAFAAAGPLADFITAGPLPLPPHIPNSTVGKVHELDGQVLLLGVGHDANTMIHLAEILGGAPYRVPKHITVVRDGEPTRIDYDENDHCCQRFALMDEWLRSRGLMAEGKVGNAQARLIRAKDVVKLARDEIVRDPLIFLHPAEARCDECDLARKSVGKV